MQDLQKLSDSELLELLDKTERSISEYDTFQMALKILMNSLYGALANKYFPLFNPEIAKGITSNGRYFIRGMADYVNEAINDILKSNNQGVSKNYIAYGDTDSNFFDTLLFIKDTNKNQKIQVKIGELYNEVEDKHPFLKNDTEKEDFVIDLRDSGLKTDSVKQLQDGSLEIQEKEIVYIMKHKVKKEMFKVSFNENGIEREVICTEDHCVMVMRNDVLISVKPKEIQETDEIIYIMR